MYKYILLILLALTWNAERLDAQSQCSVTHYDEFSGMAQWYVTQIVQDRQGIMWFSTWNGLNRYDGYQFECFKSQAGDGVDIPSDRIDDIMMDEVGNLLCLIDGRVFLFDVKTCRYHGLNKEQEARYLKDFNDKYEQDPIADSYIHKDAYGCEWRILQDGALFWRGTPTEEWHPYSPNIPMKGTVRLCTTDTEGNVWLSSRYGAYRLTFKQSPYQFFHQEKPAMIRSFLLDGEQRYWVASQGDATVRIFDKNGNQLGYLGRDGRLHTQYTSFGSPVYAMIQDSQGVFWLGSKPDGLFRLYEDKPGGGVFSVEQFRHNDGTPSSLSHDHVFFIREDKHGRLWVATMNGGLNCVEHPHDKELRFVHKDNGLKLPKETAVRVRQIHITPEGILFAATTQGLWVADINNENVRNIAWKLHTKDSHRSSSLSNNATMFVAEDFQHRLYVCTESGGVNQVLSTDLLAEQLEFRHYDTSTNFPSDVALSAVAEEDYLLVVSNNQLIRLYLDEKRVPQADAYFWKDHLRFSDAIPLKLPNGKQLIGLQDGAMVIHPDDIQKSQFVPSIALTGLSIQAQPIQRAVNLMDTLVLTPPNRGFTIHFSALSYANEEGISYAFQMGGKQEPWNYIGKNRSATFLDLRPGTYQLRIRSTNGDGVWVDNARALTIIVKPTFWETPWAQLLYFLLLCLVIWGVLRTRRHIKNITQKQRELHEAYLALLNAQNKEVKAESPAVPKNATAAVPALKPEDEAFMQRAVKFIEEHISDADINIGDMADATATSRSGLNRKMKSLLGVTPLDFIREARIQKACQLLKEGMSVNDVAYECGFSDPKYFAKCFKAQMGMTPTGFKATD